MSARRVKSVTLLACVAALTVLFAANARYVYSDSLDRVPRLTAGHIADPRFAGSTFRVEGEVRSVGTSSNGIMFIDLYQPEQDLNIDVPVFPSVGSPPVRPGRGDVVRVTGNLGTYRGQPQLGPLSAAHVEVLTPAAATAPPVRPWNPSDTAVTLGAAATRIGETLLVGPLTAIDVEPFTSRAGRQHVRLVLADPESTVQGILYQGDWTEDHVTLLKSGEPLIVAAEISEYRDRPSLVVRQIHTLD